MLSILSTTLGGNAVRNAHVNQKQPERQHQKNHATVNKSQNVDFHVGMQNQRKEDEVRHRHEEGGQHHALQGLLLVHLQQFGKRW